MVDTGSQLNIHPSHNNQPLVPQHWPFIFQAVNSSPNTTFGTRSLYLDIGLRRVFSWVFVFADVHCAIFGDSFLAAVDPMVDCSHSRSLANTLDSPVDTSESLLHRTTLSTTSERLVLLCFSASASCAGTPVCRQGRV
ncbi:unnamed protein product [Schistocephalus solidus]|uniref:Uncharacterized protein n=1 Tax=Schistocephalus solidus TaxID=70667 RepID=A0A183T334_SCHSO|nr:unnamed protein product [Schistocephalus solidus]